FFFSSRRRHTRLQGDWSSDVCSSDLLHGMLAQAREQLPEAAAAYQSALALARRAGDLHGAAIYAQNLGTVLREQAEYERALAPKIGRASCRERVESAVAHGTAEKTTV